MATTLFVIKTDNAGSSTSTQFTLPLLAGGTYDLSITALSGPGTLTGSPVTYAATGGTATPQTLDFSVAGTYEIAIEATLGNFLGFSFNNGGDRLKLIEISQMGALQLQNAFDNPVFQGCTNLSITASDLSNFITGVNSLSGAFRNTGNWTSARFPHFGTINFSSVERFNSMFRESSPKSFDLDLSNMSFSAISILDRLALIFTNRVIATPRYNAFLKSIANQIQAETMVRGIGTLTQCNFGSSLYDLGAPKTAFDYITSPIVNIAFTADAATNIITCVGHGLSIGNCITLKTTGTLPAGLDTSTRYYVNTADTVDTFTVSLTEGGSTVDITDAGTGTHTVFGGGGMVINVEADQNTGVFEVSDYILANSTALTDELGNVISGARIAMIDKTRLEEIATTVTAGGGVEVISNNVILAMAVTDATGFISVNVTAYTNFNPNNDYILCYYYETGGLFYPGPTVKLNVVAS